jgi:hypothetical protein
MLTLILVIVCLNLIALTLATIVFLSRTSRPVFVLTLPEGLDIGNDKDTSMAAVRTRAEAILNDLHKGKGSVILPHEWGLTCLKA